MANAVVGRIWGGLVRKSGVCFRHPMNEFISTAGEMAPAGAPSRVRTRRRLAISLASLVLPVVVLAIWTYNSVVADRPLQRVLAADPRNMAIKAHAHFGDWLDAQTLVFDIDGVSGEASRLDVLRVFLQYAEAMDRQQYKTVVLACRGNRKFEMDGRYFQQLGSEYNTQNPMYTIRTLPFNLRAMDGSHPYTEYDGGIFAVLTAEMKQFADFSDRWYGNDLLVFPRAQK
jgi:hypothetical protein